MPDTRYDRGKEYAASMAVYARLMSEDNSEQLRLARRRLAKALREDVTPRQRQYLLLYYDKGLNMREIADLTGTERSTVSRTIKRGEARLRRCLRYGAGIFLRQDD